MSYLEQYAVVDYRPGAAIAGLAKLRTFSAGDPAMGLSQGDAVQLAVDLAQLRDRVTVPTLTTIALYRDGAFVARELATSARVADIEADPALGWMPIVGTTPLESPPTGPSLVQVGEQLGVPSITAHVPDDWGKQLALAIDGVLRRIADAKGGSETYDLPGAVNVIAIPLLAVIVGGAAVAVIGAVGVWRYFDPTLRAQTEAVTAASMAYAARLQVFEQTKVMPPVSPVEEASAAAVIETAKDQTSAAWLIGGGVAGGVALTTLALGALNRSEVRA